MSRPRLGAHALRLLVVTISPIGCGESVTDPMDPPPLDPPEGPKLETVITGLDRPLLLTAPSGDSRIFVVEQSGAVRVVSDGAVVATFLDLTGQVSGGNEQGLLGLAFHPSFDANGRFFVSYTDPAGDTRLVEYHASQGSDVADGEPVRTILEVEQPFSNHNGGHVVFGPDGMLYFGLGDGGSGGDPANNGQDLETLLGSLLRLDVDGETPYEIPTDNPFVGQPGAREEIWAYGLRNPWRFSFDVPLGLLIIGDVGQNAWEEIDVAPAGDGGLNYGWRVMEGLECFVGPGCGNESFTVPALVYSHAVGCSVTGGHVYRGASAPSLRGKYLFSDFCSGWIRVVTFTGDNEPDVTQLNISRPGSVSSFGQDGFGESYVLTIEGGIFRLVE